MIHQDLPPLNVQEMERVEWILAPNRIYSSRFAKEAIRVHKGGDIRWSGNMRLLWFEGHVPKQAFIIWLDFKGRLLTIYRLKQWCYIQEDECVLSASAVEDILLICSLGVLILKFYGMKC